MRSTLSSFFSALEQELLELALELWLAEELVAALGLRELVAALRLLCLLSFLSLVLRPLPMDNTGRWETRGQLRSSTIEWLRGAGKWVGWNGVGVGVDEGRGPR